MIDNCRNMQRPLGIWTNIAIFKLLMPLIVPRFGGPVQVKMVNIRTHFFHQFFKFAISFWKFKDSLPVYSTTKHWIVYKSYRIVVEGVTLSDSRRSFDRFALKPLHYIIRCWATFIRFYYWTTSRPISEHITYKGDHRVKAFSYTLDRTEGTDTSDYRTRKQTSCTFRWVYLTLI